MEQSLYEFSKFMTLIRTATDGDFEVIKLLQKRLNKANTGYVGSENFRHTLATTKEKIEKDPDNKYVHIREFVVELKAYEEKPSGDDRPTKVKREPKPEPKEEEPQPSTSRNHKETKRVKLHTTAERNKKAKKEMKKESDEESGEDEPPPNVDEKTARHIRKLEKLLGKVSDEIEKLEAKELSLEQLDDDQCTYILLDRYKRKFVKIWERLCSLRGRDTSSGRVIEQKFQYSGSKYPEINRLIEKFVNKFKAFPDYSDVLEIVEKCRTKYRLKLSKKMIETLAKDIFTEVGNNLQERRHKDLLQNFGCQLTDHFRTMDDPALYDRELRAKLDANRKKAKTNLEAVISKFAYKQEEEGDGTDDEEKEEEESEPVAKKQKSAEKDSQESSPAPPMEEDKEANAANRESDAEPNAVVDGKPSVESDVESMKEMAGVDTSFSSALEERSFEVEDPKLSPILPLSPAPSSPDLSSSLPDIFGAQVFTINSSGEGVEQGATESVTEASTGASKEQSSSQPESQTKDQSSSEVIREDSEPKLNESVLKETSKNNTAEPMDTGAEKCVGKEICTLDDALEVKAVTGDSIAKSPVRTVTDEEENMDARVCVLDHSNKSINGKVDEAKKEELVVCVLDSSGEIKPDEDPRPVLTSVEKPNLSADVISDENQQAPGQKVNERTDLPSIVSIEKLKSSTVTKPVSTPPPETDEVCILDDSSDEEPKNAEDAKAKKLQAIVQEAAQKTLQVRNEYLKKKQEKQKKEQKAQKQKKADDKEQAMQNIINEALKNVTMSKKRKFPEGKHGASKHSSVSKDHKKPKVDEDVEVHMLSDSDEEIIVDKKELHLPFTKFSKEQKDTLQEKAVEKAVEKSLLVQKDIKKLAEAPRSESPSRRSPLLAESNHSPSPSPVRSPMKSAASSARSSPVAVSSPKRATIPYTDIPTSSSDLARRVARNLEAKIFEKDSLTMTPVFKDSAQIPGSPSGEKSELVVEAETVNSSSDKSDEKELSSTERSNDSKEADTSKDSQENSRVSAPEPSASKQYSQTAKTTVDDVSKAVDIVCKEVSQSCSEAPKISSPQVREIVQEKPSSSSVVCDSVQSPSKANGKEKHVEGPIEKPDSLDDDVKVVGSQATPKLPTPPPFSLKRLNLAQLKDNVRRITNGLKQSKKPSEVGNDRVVSISDDEDEGPSVRPRKSSVILLE